MGSNSVKAIVTQTTAFDHIKVDITGTCVSMLISVCVCVVCASVCQQVCALVYGTYCKQMTKKVAGCKKTNWNIQSQMKLPCTTVVFFVFHQNISIIKAT